MASIVLRLPKEAEFADISDLCLRSKAFWGYDDAFMTACLDELTVRPEELEHSDIVVAEDGQTLAGVAQVSVTDGRADLMRLYVDPAHMGKGVGAVLFDWAVQTARTQCVDILAIEADPHAEPFYRKRGAKRVGEVPSGSIPGRVLPLLHLPL